MQWPAHLFRSSSSAACRGRPVGEGDRIATVTRWCHDHAGRVGLCWIIVLSLSVFVLRLHAPRNDAISALSPQFSWATLLGGLDAARGEALIQSRFGEFPIATDILCARLLPIEERFPSISIDESVAMSESHTLLTEAARCREPLLSATNPFAVAPVVANLPVPVTQVELAGTPRDVVIRTMQRAKASRSGLSFEVPETTTSKERRTDVAADLRRAERIGLLVALIVLAVVLRSIVAPIVPIVLGLVSVGVAVGMNSVLNGFDRSPFYVDETISMIGMAVSIDYALFVIHRYCEERNKGSVISTTAGSEAIAIRTVLASGAVMIVAMAGMLLVPVSIFRQIALGGMLVVAISVVATITLMPPLLRLLGNHLEWPRRRCAHRCTGPDMAWSRIWLTVGRLTTRHPLIAIALVAVLFVPLNIAARDLRRDLAGLNRPQDASATTAPLVEDAQTAMAGMVLSMVEVTVDADRSVVVQDGINRLVAALGEDHRFAPFVTVQWNDANDLAVVSAALVDSRGDLAALGAVDQLRETVIADAFNGVPASVRVTGPVAARAEVLETFSHWEHRVRLLVLLTSFLGLLVIFRSVVVPIKAIAISLITVGAVHGLLVLVFQKGYGAAWFGFQPVQSIEAWVPLFLFCVLFGISMDYHIFLLARIREHFWRTGDHQGSLIAGLQTTGGVVTGAATIMAVVFASFAGGGVPALQQIGLGLAAAVILDASLVRCVLIPALMTLLGDANWYLPPWLRWLPDFQIARAEQLSTVPTPAIAAGN